MTKYNEKYTHIKKDTIKAVRKKIKEDKIFKKPSEERMRLLKELNAELCEIYNLIPCEIAIERNTDGYFNPIDRKIVLNEKLSLVTFLHEFKHFIQHEKQETNTENIARGWSISLFFRASKKHYDRAVKKGLIIHERVEQNINFFQYPQELFIRELLRAFQEEKEK